MRIRMTPRLITELGFAKPNMYRAWANGMAPDRASARFLQKAGSIHEATLRAAVVDREGARHDELVYARMRE